MSNKEDFKKFVYKNPKLIDYVKQNNISWQSLYEIYDIYGEKEEIWNECFKRMLSYYTTDT